MIIPVTNYIANRYEAVVFYSSYLAHERATGITEAGIPAAALVAGAEHVVGDAVQRQKPRAPPALCC